MAFQINSFQDQAFQDGISGLGGTVVGPPFYVDPDTFFTATLNVTIRATFFTNHSLIFIPKVSLVSADAQQMIKNEVRRTVFLKHGDD